MLKTKCLKCRQELLIDNIREGEGYFFGYDTAYYGDKFDDMRDPHEVIGYYCKKCGEELRLKSDTIGFKRID